LHLYALHLPALQLPALHQVLIRVRAAGSPLGGIAASGDRVAGFIGKMTN
jgi:hypothetical protein